MALLERIPSESAASVQPILPELAQSRKQRHDLFRQHVQTCPLCVHEHNEMCTTGYRLLQACLE